MNETIREGLQTVTIIMGPKEEIFANNMKTFLINMFLLKKNRKYNEKLRKEKSRKI